MRLTYTRFSALYVEYKNMFDLELALRTKGITYNEFQEKSIENEEWVK